MPEEYIEDGDPRELKLMRADERIRKAKRDRADPNPKIPYVEKERSESVTAEKGSNESEAGDAKGKEEVKEGGGEEGGEGKGKQKG